MGEQCRVSDNRLPHWRMCIFCGMCGFLDTVLQVARPEALEWDMRVPSVAVVVRFMVSVQIQLSEKHLRALEKNSHFCLNQIVCGVDVLRNRQIQC